LHGCYLQVRGHAAAGYESLLFTMVTVCQVVFQINRGFHDSAKHSMCRVGLQRVPVKVAACKAATMLHALQPVYLFSSFFAWPFIILFFLI
jgi:hypothetical protein